MNSDSNQKIGEIGDVVYRGNPRGLQRLLGALRQRTDTTPLVVNDNVGTAIVPFENVAPVHSTAYLSPVASTVPMSGYGSRYRSESREYGRAPSSIGDWLLVAYAMPFALWDALMDGAKGRFSGR